MSDPFTWKSYLELAESLKDKVDPTEAELRSAISRAYYAAFHSVKEGKSDIAEKIADKKEGIHSVFWRELKSLQGKNTALAEKGKRLMESRVAADYYNPFSETRDTSVLVKKAEEVIQLAKILINAYPPKVI
jgi:uncharacterized protein (UPF0332 family)